MKLLLYYCVKLQFMYDFIFIDSIFFNSIFIFFLLFFLLFQHVSLVVSMNRLPTPSGRIGLVQQHCLIGRR